MEKFKKHPVDVYKNRRFRLTRIHALEIARRAMEAGENPQASATNEDVLASDSSNAWPQMVGAPPKPPFSGTPFEGM